MVSSHQLFVKSGLVNSGKEAKRLITENGAKINDQIIKSTDYRVKLFDLKNSIKLSAGKKRHIILKTKIK